jgi:mRNA interferase MazF
VKAAPDRGEVIWLSLDPPTGHEQAGRRPVLVLTPRTYNAARGLMIACPITTRVKGYVFEVPLSVPGVNGVVLADHVRSVDWRVRRWSALAVAPAPVVDAVAKRVAALIGAS